MEDNAELESFRQKWREEVSSRRKPNKANDARPQAREQARRTDAAQREHEFTAHAAPVQLPPEVIAAKEDQTNQSGLAPLHDKFHALNLREEDPSDAFAAKEPAKPPESALEHFEQAAKKEAQGNLGSSLDLYRKAYKLDQHVDKAYRQKHFPRAKAQLPQTPTQTAATTAAKENEAPSLSTPDLIASFADVPILQAEPLIENTPPPPCPIADVPREILIEILCQVALLDPASLPRLALVCKRMAWHIANEQSVYKLLCQDNRFGFTDMHYKWNTDVVGHQLYTFIPRFVLFPPNQTTANDIPKPLNSWREVYQFFPRIRFTGIYISTVNYNRPGAHSNLTNVSWGAPIHVVTYYRYLRFYPDGTVVSLLTTTEPVDIVRYISKENIDQLDVGMPARRRNQRGPLRPPPPPQPLQQEDQQQTPLANPIPHAAQLTLRNALKGRWRLQSPSPDPSTLSTDPDFPDDPSITPDPPTSAHEAAVKQGCPDPDPRDLTIETEGVDAKYIFRMHLSLRSAHSRSTNVAKNTRLVWRSFWSYNQLTDDWAEFGLRNDRPFVFSRVRGWGME